MQPPTAVPRVAPGVRRPHLQQARNGHTWWQKKSVRGRSSRHSCRCGSASWPVADAALSASPTAPPARRPRECGRSGGPGVAGAAVGHGGGRGSPTALVVLRLSGGPRPFGPASFAVCPFGFLPVSYWVLPLIPIACRSCLYLQGVGPSSLPYGAVWLAGCLGGAQPEARGQDTGHSHHNPGAVQTSGLSSAGGPGSLLSTQTAREARVFSPAAAGPG